MRTKGQTEVQFEAKLKKEGGLLLGEQGYNGYWEWVGFYTQVGSSHPVVDTLYTTFPGALTFTRVEDSFYRVVYPTGVRGTALPLVVNVGDDQTNSGTLLANFTSDGPTRATLVLNNINIDPGSISTFDGSIQGCMLVVRVYPDFLVVDED